MSETMENVTEKAEETKAEKFIRLGEYRMNKAIDAIGRIENLANRSAYDYTPEQVGAMFSVLESITRMTGTALWNMPRCTAKRIFGSLSKTGWK